MHKQGRPTPEGCAAHLKSLPLMAAPGSRSNTCAPAARLARTGGTQHHRHASIRQKMPTRQEMPFCAPSTDPTAETDPVPTLGGYCLLGSPLGLVTAGEGLGRDAVAGPHAPGCPVSAGSYRSQAAMAWPISAPESFWMKWMPGTVIGGAGLRREAAAARRSRRPGPAGPLPGRCHRSR